MKEIYRSIIGYECFLNHTRCGYKKVINHIDNNKLNNVFTNLELVSQRENANKKHLKSTSKYTGVSLPKGRKHWRSIIMIKGKNISLGNFKTELEANNAYQKKLKQINNESFF